MPDFERDDAYADGYAAGKSKSWFELRARLQDPEGHARFCGSDPRVIIREVRQTPTDR